MTLSHFKFIDCPITTNRPIFLIPSDIVSDFHCMIPSAKAFVFAEKSVSMKFQHPLWLAGFRPFFTFAFVFGSMAPLLWFFLYSGKIQIPPGGLSSLQWHAHEMFFGFGWAVLGGFLLTASKNWVSVRGIHGAMLAWIAAFWVVERFSIFYLGVLPPQVTWIFSHLFLISIASYIFWTLYSCRKQDSYRDNFIFLMVLPLFLIAKDLVLSREYFSDGVAMTIGLFRVAFVVMLERTLTQFMKNTFNLHLYRNFYLDSSIKLLAILLIFEKQLPVHLSLIALMLIGSLLFLRFCRWKPIQAFKNFGISLSYLGYLGLTLHFFSQALVLMGVWHPVGSVVIHIFTFLCMGILVSAMMLRISQGHTGRKFTFTRSDRWGIYFLFMAAFFRLVATQIWPLYYEGWVFFAALGWALCFAILGYRLIPFLWKARLDGKIH